MGETEDRIRKILVARLSAIGDVILTLAVVDALRERFPAAAIDYVVKSEFSELVQNHPALRRVWSFDRGDGFSGWRGLTRQLRGEHYDLLVDLHSNLRSVYLRWFGGAWMRRAHRKRILDRWLLLHFGVNRLRNAPGVADRYFTAVEDFGVVRQGRRPRLYLSPAAERGAAEALLSRGIEGEDRFLAVAGGASYPTKQWPAPAFARAAAELLDDRKAVALLGGRSDREVTAEVARELRRLGICTAELAGELSLSESAAVIAKCDLLLTNDTGLMHIADALDRPLVAIFGPTSRELGFYPLGEKARVVEETQLECRPCTRHGGQICPKKHHLCMKEVRVESVVAAGREVAGR